MDSYTMIDMYILSMDSLDSLILSIVKDLWSLCTKAAMHQLLQVLQLEGRSARLALTLALNS